MIILILFFLAAYYFTTMEIAYVGINKLKLDFYRSMNSFTGSLVSKLNEKPSHFIAMMLFGNLFSISMVLYLSYNLVTDYPWLNGINSINSITFITLFTAVVLLPIIFFSIVLPRLLFHPALIKSDVLSFFSIVLFIGAFPVVYLIILIAEFILKYLFNVPLHERRYIFSSVNIDEYVKDFSQIPEHTPDETDIKIFKNAVDFKWVKVRECMVPRTEISAIDMYSSISDLNQLFTSSGHSKILVYDRKIDNIIGYVHVFDLFKSPKAISQIKRKISFVPETLQANVLLERMIREKLSLVVVLDEFGGTSGVITLEDLMEEIVGDIEDEFDNENLIEKRLTNGQYLLSARLEIDYLNEKYNLNIEESDEYETLGGYIIHHTEEIPTQGDFFRIQDLDFKIVKASQSRIELIQLSFKV
ncbi:MAG: HlyC/CorC family transporter [Bacteroidales bacterium]|nr:HlyC/CorC family transporter [Bacteroidales bacterium]